MAQPVVEQIAAAVRSRLTGTQGVSNVSRPPKFSRERPINNQVVVTQESNEPNPDLMCPGNPPAMGYDLTLLIASELRPSDTDPVAIDRLRNKFYADVVKAITTPPFWHNWGGLALDTVIGTAEPTQDESSVGFHVRIVIKYRVSENNPYEVRA